VAGSQTRAERGFEVRSRSQSDPNHPVDDLEGGERAAVCRLRQQSAPWTAPAEVCFLAL